jgi:hypothetical protein
MKLLKQLNVDAIAYDFDADQQQGCAAPVNKALILIRPDRIDPSQVKIFGPDATLSSAQNSLESQILRRILADGSDTHNGWQSVPYATPISPNDNSPAVNEAIIQYKAEHLLSCANLQMNKPMVSSVTPCPAGTMNSEFSKINKLNSSLSGVTTLTH